MSRIGGTAPGNLRTEHRYPDRNTGPIWPELLCVLGFLLLTWILSAGGLLELDVAVRDWCDTHRPEALRVLAWALKQIGSAKLLAAVLGVASVLLALRWRSPAPVLRVLLTLGTSYVAIMPIKWVTDREAPRSGEIDAVHLFVNAGESYPSGHVVNTLIWYPVLIVLLAGLLRRRLSDRTWWWIRAVPVVVVFVTVTYLSYHWLTDSVAGLLLGVALDRLLRRLPWDIRIGGFTAGDR